MWNSKALFHSCNTTQPFVRSNHVWECVGQLCVD
jgi:hypothetical protein